MYGSTGGGAIERTAASTGRMVAGRATGGIRPEGSKGGHDGPWLGKVLCVVSCEKKNEQCNAR
jgi:hypothetical protein